MISKSDKELIFELQKNGRASYTELASILSVSVSTAASRTEKLIKANIIEVKAIPNPAKMGLVANAMIVIQVDPLTIEAICDQFKENIFVSTILTIFGKFDILMIVSFPSWEELQHFIIHEISKTPGVLKIETFFLDKITKRYLNNLDDLTVQTKEDDITDLEWKLVYELAKNGRISLNDLSKKVGSHISTISRKLNSLIERHIITIAAIPNPNKFGFYSHAFIVLSAEVSKIEAISEALYSFSEIVFIAPMINGSSIIIGIQTKNNEELYRIIKDKVARVDGIQKIDSFITAELKKRFYGWLMKKSEISSK